MRQLRIALAILLPLLMPWSFFQTAHAEAPKQIQIALRLDDYSEISDTRLELKIIEIFRRNKCSFTMGVIPFVSSGIKLGKSSPVEIMLGEKKAQYLKDAAADGTVEIALHGYNHSSNYAPFKAEFLGIGYEEQLRRLTVAKRHLEQVTGFSVTNFIPPWNQYNEDTIQALKLLNFSIMSAAIEHHSETIGSIKLLPHTTEILGLERAVMQARNSKELNPLIVVMLHEYDFTDNSAATGVIALKSFDELITRLAAQSDITIESLGKTAASQQSLTLDRFLLNNKIRKAERHLPSQLTVHKELVYRSTPNTIWRQIGLFYGLMLGFTVLFASVACRLKPFQHRFVHVVAGLLLFAVCAGTVYQAVSANHYPPRSITLAVLSIGCLLGVLLHNFLRFMKLRMLTNTHSTDATASST